MGLLGLGRVVGLDGVFGLCRGARGECMEGLCVLVF
jgi:hypothetical protein